jgi:alkanesulfonate monooxygenase SsuD/methylene tetrahydromethanopterin reductase-like flavin-dependent oxidoreductase (luciferase family)
MPDASPSLVLAVALDGAGHHPAAWRDPAGAGARPLDPEYWVRVVRRADEGLLDLVTFEDSFGRPPTRRPGRFGARLDAALVAARVAPVTRHVGLVPVVTTTHTEPFHVASASATLDHVSGGRAGWQARVSSRPSDAALVGVRPPPPVAAAFAEAADVVEAVRRLWDSWEDDAIVRDVASGRFVDRSKLHYVDVEADTFTVKGPSIVPRPPQGQPVVAALSHVPLADEFAARAADVVFVTPAGPDDAATRVAEVRAAEAAVGRAGEPLRVVADLAVALAGSTEAAAARLRRLDDLDGAEWRPDAPVFAGTARDLADLIVAGQRAGLAGYRLRPVVLEPDLDAIVDDLVPELQRRGAFRREAPPATLRERLGLPRPASRYAAARP